jgi:hypothetical protein
MHWAAEGSREVRMPGQPGCFDLGSLPCGVVGGGRPAGAAGSGDRLRAVPPGARDGARALGSGQDRRPPYGAVLTFKVLVLVVVLQLTGG